MEIGQSAHEYLENCFIAEVSVLDREKFHAVPKIIKSDFVIAVSEFVGSISICVNLSITDTFSFPLMIS